MAPDYPLPWRTFLNLLISLARGERRSFRADACALLRGDSAHPGLTLRVTGKEHIPTGGPALVVVNHYTRLGPHPFRAWWIALAISSCVPVEIHWTMTSAWTYAGSPSSWVLAGLTRWLFPRFARTYGFTAMPPMPPRPFEEAARAQAVRRVLAAAKSQPQPVIGMAPEGQDAPGGVLMRPPAGAGRFIHHLARLGYPIYPAGVYEDSDALCLSFGPPEYVELSPSLSSRQIEERVSRTVMQALARQLPESLRGEFGD